MRLTMLTLLVVFCILPLGCQEETTDKTANERLMNRTLINTYSDIAIQNAIISEHTLYPYHFVKNGAELNELGLRDLAVLAGHFDKNGGHLNVRQLEASAELYEARVNFVREKLREAGIDMAGVSISDGMPGGSGMPSEKVLDISEQEGSVGTSTTSSTMEMR